MMLNQLCVPRGTEEPSCYFILDKIHFGVG